LRDEVAEMLLTNRRQKAYYDAASGWGTNRANSAITNLWRWLKIRALGVFELEELVGYIDRLHLNWIGDVSDAKVLDLGCGSGNTLSVQLAASCREYVAIDLSETHLAILQEKLAASDAQNAKVKAIDFLSQEFSDGEFDLIYARSVLHHFRYFDKLLDRLESKLRPGGRIITYDPVQTWLPVRLLRTIIRPWQTDAQWEYPFNAAALLALESRFTVIDRRGIWGRSKWASIIGLIAPRLGGRFARAWHAADIETNTTERSIYSCLQVTYHLTAAQLTGWF
jgi:2-polyprenyl-3-methyl-5-hydroxy-6-metoxy-1,4-benzoquinol methylase